MKKSFISLLLFAAVSISGVAQGLFPAQWKFQTGDSLQYADPLFNDFEWKTISPYQVWERQGYATYDGFAWYRVTFVVPSSLKKDAFKYGGLLLNLGRIDDVDFTYFNGILVGSTGKLPPDYVTEWSTRRAYTIAPDAVLWGKPNTLAVRVYDASGDGGIYSEPVSLTIKGNPNFITLSQALTQPDRIITGSPDAEIPISLQNGLPKTYIGQMNLKAVSDFGEEIASLSEEISIKKYLTGIYTYRLTNLDPGFYKVTVALKGKQASKETAFNFGFEPEKIVSPADPQPDFADFWARAKNELAGVDPQFKMIKIDSLCTPAHNIYLVEMRSLDSALIRGWYQVPVKPGRYPAVMQVPGYNSTIIPSYINYGKDIIGFGLNIRGHGNSKDDVNPGFPGYILTNIEDKEKYIYRGAYMDCIRGIDFLFSRPEVDTAHVAVEGASQGGALTFVTAALDNERIAVCAPQVPFLSDFEHYFKVATWPGNEFINFVEKEKRMTWEEVYRTLSYFDIKNLAPMIKAPLIMGVGLVDDVCPPHINFAAYNNVTAEKKYIVYPEAGHGLPGDFYRVKMEWIKSKLGMQ
ncbi:MAG TPA: acetylxylan esterase [Bacteroidales bacterium]|nr:acetylxylan esterase [Bacteroidales bacterium]